MRKFFRRSGRLIALSAAISCISLCAYAGKDFIKHDVSDRDSEFVQVLSQRLSAENLTLLIHGGNRTLQMSAYKAAQRLDDDGYSIAFVLASDRDGVDVSMSIDFYTDGSTQYGLEAYDNHKSTPQMIEDMIYEQAIVAHDDARLVSSNEQL